MRERDAVRIELAGKIRVAVVLEIREHLVRVAYGTTEEHAWPRAVVHVGGRPGRSLDLRETTYFYGANTCWEQVQLLAPCGTRCTMELLFEIRKLVEAHDAEIFDE